jgi:acetolactate synthase-1/2/3 large subunit
MKASDLLVRCLENEGIRYIFGVPGEENADFMMSLDGSPIRFVLTRHEQGAAFMAEVYGRLDGNPAVCLGTLGPGATNLLTGVADGNMDHAPMLVITAQASTDRQHKESHQVIDIVRLYEPVTKWSYGIRHPDSIPEIVRKAVRVARSEKPGAVLLELPENVAAMETAAVPLEPRRFRRPGPDDKIVDRAWEVIRNARRPIIIAGNGAIRKRASRQLRRFCEATGIGVLMTFMGKGAVDRDRAPAEGLARLRRGERGRHHHARLRPHRVPAAFVEPEGRRMRRAHRLLPGRDRRALPDPGGVRRGHRAHVVDAERTGSPGPAGGL